VQIHPEDAARCGVATGDLAEVSTADARVLARVDVTRDVHAGTVFAPMHWSAQFASAARIGVLMEPITDPVSGQPELKHTPVRVRRYVPAWHGFALVRGTLDAGECAYVARSRGEGFWRYELAGESVPASWPDWAERVLGQRGERIELHDPAGGRYRGARVAGGRLQACLFVAPTKQLPSRTWLAGLFANDALDDGARSAILAGRPAKAGEETGPTVCSCFSVGRSTLLRAIRSQELVTTEQIGKALRAGTNCGSCVPELKVLLAEAGAVPA
jgi:assimilatory nitrate reductase catalytic subunit